ncbi:hypothetical protein [Pseudomonas sp. LS-2]|uniref:hypothetical protein n=1 Tax=Pseudomonas sp. LS-2 TaxID=2315859 RepID=UPI000E735491|nr:hypothetical protein [Pseudomonas sp. LS-2]RJX78947.1 hypothetical protein D3M70_16185 [Pseudomonas sp. LS-2]
MKILVAITACVVVGGCSWNSKTVSTASYKMADIDTAKTVTELRLYAYVNSSESCSLSPGTTEAASLLAATLIGAGVKQVAAYGKEQLDLAINYLKSDVKIDAKTLLAQPAVSESGDTTTRICALVVYGEFKAPSADDPVAKEFFSSLASKSGLNMGMMSSRLGQYKVNPSSQYGIRSELVGQPAFLGEFEIKPISNLNPASGKVVYRVSPILVLYPHPLHKGVSTWFDRSLSVELGFSDAKAIIQLEGLKPGALYKQSQLVTRVSIVQGSSAVPINILTGSVIEGPDKAPSGKVLEMSKEAIDAKVADYNAKADGK